MKHRSTKHYGHEQGLSACFRQWRAKSHCNLLHGYALAVTFVFEADELDERNWVVDFGGLAMLKDRLKKQFDHTLVIAEDDPKFGELVALGGGGQGLADVRVMPNVGCEEFARWAYYQAQDVLILLNQFPRVRVVSCEVREHGANSAIFCPEPNDTNKR